MQIYNNPARNLWPELTQRAQMNTQNLFGTVGEILEDIRQKGDSAVREYSERFDKVSVADFLVSEKEKAEAELFVSEELKSAIKTAAANIEKFHSSQRLEIKKVETSPGVVCWQKQTPIEKVGLYVPGGTAPLFSTVLMLAIPAKIAGCREIVLCSPPTHGGKIHPAVVYAATEAGVDKIYKIGGVQAIGAMSFGTQSVPKVYKIFGPGNQYVTAAKQLVAMHNTAIDMPAGPSEVLVLADETAHKDFVAADLLSQAEHGADSQSILVTTSESLAKTFLEETQKQLQKLSRRELAEKSYSNSRIIVLSNWDDIIDFINLYAPEHLIIETKNYRETGEKIVNAGSVFLGHFTPESAGDYASGTNHTLPTYGHACAYSGVNLDSFTKKITFQEITQEGINLLGQTICVMAENEQLDGHAEAARRRMIL